MRALAAMFVLGGMFLGGCGSGDDEKKKEAEKKKEWSDYAPGDPRRDIKALKKAKEVVKQAEETRKLPEEEPLAEPPAEPQKP